MVKVNEFRVLIIDDTEEVLEYVKRMLYETTTVDGLTIANNIELLQIKFEDVPNGEKRISLETIKKIIELSRQPFDFIFSDFGFVAEQSKNEQLREQLIREQRGVFAPDLQGVVLQLSDIRTRFDQLKEQNSLPRNLVQDVEANFFGHDAKILLYTNSPKPFANYFSNTQLQLRKNEVKSIFPNSIIDDYILMHEEFSITNSIINSFNSDQERRAYYANLLSGKIKSLLKTASYEYIIHNQNQLRFENTGFALKRLSEIGIAVGIVLAVLSKVMTEFLYGFCDTISSLASLCWNNSEITLITPVAIDLAEQIVMIIVLLIIGFYLVPKLGVWVARLTEKRLKKLL